MKKFLIGIIVIVLFSNYAFSQVETKDYKSIRECEENCELLIINADVPDVNVYINGVYQGKTILIIENLFPNYYEIIVEKKGYKTQTETIYLKKGFSMEYFFEMEKLNFVEEEKIEKEKIENDNVQNE